MKKYLVPKERLIQPTPKSLIKDGKAIFGSFSSSFENLNLLEVKKQSKYLPNFLNRFRLTKWEAFELDFQDGVIVTAIYNNLSLMQVGFLFYYDKNTREITFLKALGSRKKTHVAKNLVDDDSYIETKKFKLRIHNDFKHGLAEVNGCFITGRKNIELDLKVKRLSPSSIVSIPLGINKPLYSEKAMFEVEGSVKVDRQVYMMNQEAKAIIDDHKGYYPYNSHYDWLTTMTKIEHQGKIINFGFNLTKNASLDEEKYNENNIWLDGQFIYLPPVTFTHLDDSTWLIKDEYGQVNLTFKIDNRLKLSIPGFLIKLCYFLTFGKISGFLKSPEGETFILKDVNGIGEDKSTRV